MDVSAPIENNLDYAEELAQLQRQEYEALSAAVKHGFEFSIDTATLFPQANIEIRRNLVPAAGDPAGGIVPTGGVPAGSDPASSVPTGGALAGSSIPATTNQTAATQNQQEHQGQQDHETAASGLCSNISRFNKPLPSSYSLLG
nr:hypothetical protein [Tanacetum cinerariifolium]